MIKIFTFIFILACSFKCFSQDTLARDTSWKKGGFISIQFNQVAFHNWAAGGENSLSFTGIGSGFANYMEGKNYWSSFANLQYGVITTKYDRTARKNTDVLELQSKAGHQIFDHVSLTALVNFRSQFSNGYIFPNDSLVVSKFMAPGYLIISAGFEWKPVEYFSLYLSPATGKFTFVANQGIADITLNGASLYGTDPAVYDSGGKLLSPGETVRFEFGAYLNAQFVKDIFKNVNLATRLQLFNNYTDKNASNRKNVDINYDLLINLKVNKFLAASIFATVIYDNDIIIADVDSKGNPTGRAGPRTQLKEGIGIGITYKFGDELK
ncbi:MAG: DUF3078 domain-containing protein [Chitinophagales bacterium]